jgi:2-amino-4-hydroxy-6-hydroxymethyldihydropteridine diphosphokinase
MILVGLGSNRGDSAHALTGAMTEMESLAAGPYLRSSLWQTSPVDCPPGSGDFLNAVVAFQGRPTLTPELLLYRLKCMERRYGRGPVLVRNAPRELDLDLLVFDDALRHSDVFVLPHPRAIDRRFVLAPAAEVAPELRWPGTGRTVRELLATLDSAEQVRRAIAGPEGSVCPVAVA